jgi:hypothetical protein
MASGTKCRPTMIATAGTTKGDQAIVDHQIGWRSAISQALAARRPRPTMRRRRDLTMASEGRCALQPLGGRDQDHGRCRDDRPDREHWDARSWAAHQAHHPPRTRRSPGAMNTIADIYAPP